MHKKSVLDALGLRLRRKSSSVNGNEYVTQGAFDAMQRLKIETAEELGIPNYDSIYKGDLPSRVNGSVGGYMVKKMIALAEQELANSQFDEFEEDESLFDYGGAE